MSEANTILYELSSDEVVIPRPQYEALMMAVKAMHALIIGPGKKDCISRGRDALAALRAAGIETGEGK